MKIKVFYEIENIVVKICKIVFIRFGVKVELKWVIKLLVIIKYFKLFMVCELIEGFYIV